MDRHRRILLFAILLSLLLHIFIFFILDKEKWLVFSMEKEKETFPQELTFLFPENKPDDEPKQVVENINENELMPDKSNLLSDKNSRARNPVRTNEISDLPSSTGNTPYPDFSAPSSQPSMSQPAPYRRFDSRALTNNTPGQDKIRTDSEKEREEQDEAKKSSVASSGANQLLDQKKFSVEEVGALSLSTYQWEWAPYIHALKEKLGRVWYAPTAYYRLGLIHGYSIITFEIDRSGEIIRMELVQHEGHESLQISSTEAIKALFPFLPLPESFPENTLTITAKLVYPDLRSRR